nr:5449_t:CDS:2 [Entrophospora candida]
MNNNNRSQTTNYNHPPLPPKDGGGPRPMDLDYIEEINLTNIEGNAE